MPRERMPGPSLREIHFTDDDNPRAVAGVGGALYPEWDIYNNRYRPERCRVIDFPLTTDVDVSPPVLCTTTCSGDGCPASGSGRKSSAADPTVTILTSRRSSTCSSACGQATHHPNTSIRSVASWPAISACSSLLDASGSATDTDPEGLAVHDHRRRAAATITVTLEELGDRVAVYRSDRKGGTRSIFR